MTYREAGVVMSNSEESDVMHAELLLVIPFLGEQLESGLFNASPKSK